MILDINQLFMLKSMLRKDRMLTAGILKIYVLWLIHSICFGFFISFSRFSSLIMQICFDQLSRVESGQVLRYFTIQLYCSSFVYMQHRFTKIMLPSHMIKSCLSHQHNFEHKKLYYVQYLHRHMIWFSSRKLKRNMCYRD